MSIFNFFSFLNCSFLFSKSSSSSSSCSRRSFFFFLFLLFFFLLSCNHVRMQNKVKADSYVEMGKAYLLHKNYPASFDALFKARDLDPKNPVVFNYLGLTYFVKKKYHLAEKAFKRALELNENYTQARIHLGELFLAIGLTPLAIKTLEKAAEDITYSQPEVIALNLGIAYFIQKKFSKAQRHFKDVLSISPKDCSAQVYYGRLLFEKKLYGQALVRFEKGESICKKDKERQAEILYYKALCYFQLNQEQKAKLFWNEILKSSSSQVYRDKAEKMLRLIL